MYFLNRVRQATATVSTGASITLASVAYSTAFVTMDAAGAVNGRTYSYIIEEGNNFEIQEQQVYTTTGRILARGTPSLSVIGGTPGTTQISLLGGAQVRVFASAADLERYLKFRSIRNVTAASDTLLDVDGGGIVIFNRATAIAVTLPQAGASSIFLATWRTSIININTGDVTITPTTSTINGAATLVVKTGESAIIFSDGTNYRAIVTAPPLYQSQTWSAAQQKQAQANIGASVVGQCYLTVSGGNLLLSRENGRHLFINGALEEIPSSGPTLVGTGITTTNGVASGPMQYIYVYMSSGVMTLERSTTAYATDTTYGHKTKSGDATRTLVGIWAASANDTWSTVPTQGSSWFNPKHKSHQTSTNNPATSTTGALAALSGAISAPFVTFADREVEAVVKCTLNCTVATASMFLNLGLDGGTTGQLDASRDCRSSATSEYTPIHESLQKTFAEGSHTLTPIGYTSSGTVNYGGLGTRVSIQG